MKDNNGKPRLSDEEINNLVTDAQTLIFNAETGRAYTWEESSAKAGVATAKLALVNFEMLARIYERN